MLITMQRNKGRDEVRRWKKEGGWDKQSTMVSVSLQETIYTTVGIKCLR